MNPINFPIIRLTLCFVIGIALAHWLQLEFNLLLILTAFGIVAYSILWYFLKGKYVSTPYFGVATVAVFMLIGMFCYSIQDERLSVNHYTKKIGASKKPISKIKILKQLKPNNYNYRYIAELKGINNTAASGKILLNITKDSIYKPNSVDDVLLISADIKDIPEPLNPYQFNYKHYLSLQQVYGQVYLNATQIQIINTKKTSIYGFAAALRLKINNNLKRAGFKQDVLSIINALLLGQRQDIDSEIYNNYINSGTIHILAVSGLHVGIILLILTWLFKPLLLLKHGNIYRPVLIVCILWGFAVLAGLSPSVTRAVSMFSIISIAMHVKRATNIYNTLAISAFIILLFKPLWLFHVGFQLSYLAVISIVSIQPLLYRLWQPEYWVTDKLWQVLTVTVAAQLGVAPLSLYYFHQFPGLFFISNLVVIPFIGFILGFGLIIITLSFLTVIPSIFVDLFSFVISTLNQFIAWIATFEDFLIRDIPFTGIQVVLAYGIIICAFNFFKQKHYKWLSLGLIVLIGMQLSFYYYRFYDSKAQFIVFHKTKNTLIAEVKNKHLKVYRSLDTAALNNDATLKNYSTGAWIKTVTKDTLEYVYKHKDKFILLLDSLGTYKNLSFKTDYLVLSGSPKVNLNRVITALSPKQIIADGSNYTSFVSRWKATCEANSVPFHSTAKQGAFIIE